MVDNLTITLFGNTLVETAISGLHMENRDMTFLSRYRTQARIRVAQYKKCIRTNFFQNRIYINQYLPGSRRRIITCRIQKIIRFP